MYTLYFGEECSKTVTCKTSLKGPGTFWLSYIRVHGTLTLKCSHSKFWKALTPDGAMHSEEMGSYSKFLMYAYVMGTLAMKVSQILTILYLTKPRFIRFMPNNNEILH